MANAFGRFLIHVIMGFLLEDVRGQCQSSGFWGCECNFIGACNAQGVPLSSLDLNLTGYSPSGVEQFGKFIARDKQNLAYLCIDRVVAILYDCENRVPLYSATVMNEAQLNAGYQRPEVGFKQISCLHTNFQANNADYKGSSNVSICYQQPPKTGPALIDYNWYNALNPEGKVMKLNQKCPGVSLQRHKEIQAKMRKSAFKVAKRASEKTVEKGKAPTINTKAGKLSTSIHKGHLIAAQYGRGDRARVLATFTYTNTIPQFGSANSGLWSRKETALRKWGQENCAKHDGYDTENVAMYIIVGAVPSSNPYRARYFGKQGFAKYQSDDFRMNVPIATWTVACCTFKFKDSTGNYKQGTFHTFFALENDPKPDDKLPWESRKFFKRYTNRPIALFPSESDCEKDDNYIKLGL